MVILNYFSHMGVRWRSDVQLLHPAWQQMECKSNEWSPTEEKSKAISDATGHVLHSFCAGDHGFKGIVGTFLINSFLQVILFHGTLM